MEPEGLSRPDDLPLLAAPSALRLRWVTAAVVGSAGVALSGEFGWLSLLVVLVGGAAVVTTAERRRAGSAALPVGRAALPWLAWGVAFCLWELTVWTLGNNDAWPTFSMLLDPILAVPPLRFVAALGWFALGAWLVRRPAR